VIYSDWGHAPQGRARRDRRGARLLRRRSERHRGYTASRCSCSGATSTPGPGSTCSLTEDDFTYERDVDLEPFLDTLEANPQLRQVALLRDPYPSEVERGGVLGWPAESFELRDAGNGHGRLEHRNFWTMNPSLMRRSIAKMPWPSQSSSERGFGDAVLRDPDARVALWGTGEPWITHIGATRAASAY
jgi:hypothetical protein